METSTDITQLMKDVTYLTTEFDKNEFVVNARKSVIEGLGSFAVNDETKGQLYVQFEQQFAANFVRELLEAGKSMQLITADKNLKDKQALLIDAQISQANAETSLNNKQAALVEKQALREVAETNLKDKQAALVEKQALKEVAETSLKEKQATLVEKQALKEVAETILINNKALTEQKETINKEAEANLKKEQVKLVTEQTITEKLRQNDTKASINVKNQSAKATWESAKAEEARRLILVKTNVDNNILRKADYWVKYMDALGTATDVVISSTQMDEAKTAINAIDTSTLLINSAHTTAPQIITTTV